MHLPARADVQAPDGSDVRLLPSTERGSLAHFSLPTGRTSIAVAHRTVEEIWYVLSGTGEMWRLLAEAEEVTPLQPGTAITIPVGARFQFRATGAEPLTAVAITMPPWPGMQEAYPVEGKWPASV
ncbi:MAG: cupin domain-containing protein [Dehalococcoidia bacterium]|nr:cupin domain-containing protein [Dehalococcoidia bacterium]